MDSKLENSSTKETQIFFLIHLFLAILGFLIYVISYLFLQFYYSSPSLIRQEFFIFILFNSFESLVEIIISPSLKKELIIYAFGIIKFYLIIIYLNKCFTSRKISPYNSDFELDYKYFLLFIYIIISFPFEKCFILSEKYIFSSNIIIIILVFFLFRYIIGKMGILFDYLKDKKMTNSAIPDIYLPYMRAHYYYSNFNKINSIFYLSLILAICYYSLKILNLFLEDWKLILKFLSLFIKESLYCSLIIACFIFFYVLNKNQLNKANRRKEEGGEEENLAKFTVIDVDIQQDESANLSERKRKREKKSKNNDNDDDENEDEKEKNNKINENEESETLKEN